MNVVAAAVMPGMRPSTPPTIVLSTSAPKSVSEPYRRYLLGVLRKHTHFREGPIKMLIRLLFHIKYVWITPWFNI